MAGRKLSDETRWKLGSGNRGKKRSEVAKRKTSEALKGRLKSPEHRMKIALGRLGVKVSEQTKRKISVTKRKQHREKVFPEKYAILNLLSCQAFGEDYKSLADME